MAAPIAFESLPQASFGEVRRPRDSRGDDWGGVAAVRGGFFAAVAWCTRHVDRIFRSVAAKMRKRVGTRIAVTLLLATHAGLLAYSATRHSPTMLEPAFLAAGISHWQLGRFELYRVNPPLVRMVAALPVLAVGCETDWAHYYDGPGSRAEFRVGEDFIEANGERSIPLFYYARWACIPFSLVGGYFAYRWSGDLYGAPAGFITLTLWCFEPNLMAHGELITADVACTSLGIAAGYFFWKWLRHASWTGAAYAGVSLGVAELSKASWLFLFGMWPALWIVWRLWRDDHPPERRTELCIASQIPRVAYRLIADATSMMVSDGLDSQQRVMPTASRGNFNQRWRTDICQLAVILGLALYILNLGYVFNGTFTQLKNFVFVSSIMTGTHTPLEPGNRFSGTWVGELPIPFPKDYVLGIDSQKRDFEQFRQPSYLRGEWQSGGWWYYYVYGLMVKVPCAAWALLGCIILQRRFRPSRVVPMRDELVLLAPALSLLALVSLQTEFNHHLRYVFPALGLVLVFVGQSILILARHGWFLSLLLVYYVVSTLSIYPHHLAYFNEFVGGPRNGHKHLLGSSFDWGQDWFYLSELLNTSSPGTEWLIANDSTPASPLFSNRMSGPLCGEDLIRNPSPPGRATAVTIGIARLVRSAHFEEHMQCEQRLARSVPVAERCAMTSIVVSADEVRQACKSHLGEDVK